MAATEQPMDAQPTVTIREHRTTEKSDEIPPFTFDPAEQEETIAWLRSMKDENGNIHINVPTNLHSMPAADTPKKLICLVMKDVPTTNLEAAIVAMTVKVKMMPRRILTPGPPRKLKAIHRGNRGGRRQEADYVVRNVLLFFDREPFDEDGADLPPLGKVDWGDDWQFGRFDVRLDYTMTGVQGQARTIGYIGNLDPKTQIPQLEAYVHVSLLQKFKTNNLDPFAFAIILRRDKTVIHGSRPIIRVLVHTALQDHGTTHQRVKYCLRELRWGETGFIKLYNYAGAKRVATAFSMKGIFNHTIQSRSRRQIHYAIGHESNNLTFINDTMVNLAAVNHALAERGLPLAETVTVSRGRTQLGEKWGYITFPSHAAREAVMTFRQAGHPAAELALFGTYTQGNAQIRCERAQAPTGLNAAYAASDAGSVYSTGSVITDPDLFFTDTDLSGYELPDDQKEQLVAALKAYDTELAKSTQANDDFPSTVTDQNNQPTTTTPTAHVMHSPTPNHTAEQVAELVRHNKQLEQDNQGYKNKLDALDAKVDSLVTMLQTMQTLITAQANHGDPGPVTHKRRAPTPDEAPTTPPANHHPP